MDLTQVNMRQSFLTSFDLFSDNATDSSEPAVKTSLYRHPLDPRITRYTRLTSESKSLDLYGLAMLLLDYQNVLIESLLRDRFSGHVLPRCLLESNPNS